MKKYLQIAASILMLFASNTLFAQNNSQAIKLLTQSIRQHKSMEVSFTYQIIGESSEDEIAKDAMVYFQDKAYKLIMADHQTISDGTTSWTYIPEDQEVMVGNANENENPFVILDDLERDSSGVTPIFDQKGNIKTLEVEIDEGVKIILNIKEIKFDQDYPEGFFTFDEKAHPDVEVIDMR